MDVGTNPDASPGDPARAGPLTAVGAVLGATALVLLLTTWAATIGPGDALSGDGFEPRRITASDTPTSDPAGSERTDEERVRQDPQQVPDWMRAVALAVELAALGLLVYLVARLLRVGWRAWRGRQRRRRRPAEVPFEVLSTPRALAEEIARDAEDHRALLQAGDPRNAVVACWHRFEVHADAAGTGRKSWETASEFTLRILDLVAADERAVARLAAAYHEARFSDHTIGEDVRTEAVLALEQIHRSLGIRVGGVR